MTWPSEEGIPIPVFTIPVGTSYTLRSPGIMNFPDRRFAVIHLLPSRDGTPHGGARLFVVLGDDKQKVDVHVGETFAVGEETWRLDEVGMPENRRLWAKISRVA